MAHVWDYTCIEKRIYKSTSPKVPHIVPHPPNHHRPPSSSHYQKVRQGTCPPSTIPDLPREGACRTKDRTDSVGEELRCRYALQYSTAQHSKQCYYMYIQPTYLHTANASSYTSTAHRMSRRLPLPPFPRDAASEVQSVTDLHPPAPANQSLVGVGGGGRSVGSSGAQPTHPPKVLIRRYSQYQNQTLYGRYGPLVG